MIKKSLLSVVSFIIIFPFSFIGLLNSNNINAQNVNNEYIIQYKNNKISFDTKNLNKNLKSKINIKESYSKYTVVNIDDTNAVTALQKDPNIKYIEPNIKFNSFSNKPNDEYFNKQWSLNTNKQANYLKAYKFLQKNPPVEENFAKVAVIDTGVDYTHPDLVDSILRDEEGNIVGYDFVNYDNDPMDDNSHGTHISGIIAAKTNNLIGIAGICDRCKIMPVKVLDEYGGGYFIDVLNALDYAIANKPDVLNISFGTTVKSDILREKINEVTDAGILVVAAAGNYPNNREVYPASYTKVLAVGALNEKGRLSAYSSHGEFVDILAPGGDRQEICLPTEQIVSTVAAQSTVVNNLLMYNSACLISTASGDLYGAISGTSIAAPHVTATAALVKYFHPTWTDIQIKEHVLENTAAINKKDKKKAKGVKGKLDINKAIRKKKSPNVNKIMFSDHIHVYDEYTGTPMLNNDLIVDRMFNIWPNIKNFSKARKNVSVKVSAVKVKGQSNKCNLVLHHERPITTIDPWDSYRSVDEPIQFILDSKTCDRTKPIKLKFSLLNKKGKTITSKTYTFDFRY